MHLLHGLCAFPARGTTIPEDGCGGSEGAYPPAIRI